MTELEDKFNDYVKVRNEIDALKDDDIKRLQEFIDYQKEVLESRANQIEQLQMALFVERRKNLVIDKEATDKLKKFIRENYKTQEQFAEQIGVTQARISQWLTGRRIVPVKRAEQIENITCGVITSNELRTIQ